MEMMNALSTIIAQHFATVAQNCLCHYCFFFYFVSHYFGLQKIIVRACCERIHIFSVCYFRKQSLALPLNREKLFVKVKSNFQRFCRPILSLFHRQTRSHLEYGTKSRLHCVVFNLYWLSVLVVHLINGCVIQKRNRMAHFCKCQNVTHKHIYIYANSNTMRYAQRELYLCLTT